MVDSFTSPERIPLLILLAGWALLLFGGFIFGKRSEDGKRRMPVWTRMASSLVLVIAAWYWNRLASDTDASWFALPVAIGMTFGLIGDLFMAKLIIKSEKHILGGIGSFGLGHIAYIAGFIGFGDWIGASNGRSVAWIVWLIIGAVGWYLAVYRGQTKRGVLHYAALPYALLLASSTGFATGLALNVSLFIPLAIGCALFLLSDLILAAELFAGLSFPLIGDVVWLTYGPAQMLIVYSIGAALKA
ncbi:MAG: lysoplasmalogenase [Chloroflexota bacterium]